MIDPDPSPELLVEPLPDPPSGDNGDEPAVADADDASDPERLDEPAVVAESTPAEDDQIDVTAVDRIDEPVDGEHTDAPVLAQQEDPDRDGPLVVGTGDERPTGDGAALTGLALVPDLVDVDADDGESAHELVVEDLFLDAAPLAATVAVTAVEPDLATARPDGDGQVPQPRTMALVDAPTRGQIRAARRLQARKVGRLVRHIELYSLLKVALLFYTCMLLVGVVAGAVIWSVLQRSGAVSSAEGFIAQIFLLDNFRFEGPTIFRIGVLGGMVVVLVLTMLTVLGGVFFNLISDLTGGIRFSVVELESARPARSRRRRR